MPKSLPLLHSHPAFHCQRTHEGLLPLDQPLPLSLSLLSSSQLPSPSDETAEPFPSLLLMSSNHRNSEGTVSSSLPLLESRK
jgi:hypothetical protein